MASLRYLSYFMDENTPLYGGEKGVTVLPDRNIANGDTANTKRLSLHNHSGTHIDYPNHFFSEGLTSENYAAETWIFDKVFLLSVNATDNEMISFTEEQFNSIPGDTEFLILKTGFGKYRDEEKYWKYNPGISPEVAIRLKEKCPLLRVFGMDLVSITSYQNRELGRTAHRNFLGGDSPVLLVEDMDLSATETAPLQLLCFPVMIKGLDGSPVTIIAKY